MHIHAIVVDDDRASAKAVAQLLRQCGCEVALSTRPMDAVEMALAPEIDLVCLDITMPELDGFELLSLIRSHEYSRRSASVPVVAVTGLVTPADKAQALAAGFAAHLSKPVSTECLHQAIATVTSLRSSLYRTRYSGDQDMILSRAAGLQGGPREALAPAVTGLALALEQQGTALIQGMLIAAYRGAAAEAAAPAQRLGSAAEGVGALHLAQLCQDFALAAEATEAARFESAAVLVRAELDRVIFTLRERAFTRT